MSNFTDPDGKKLVYVPGTAVLEKIYLTAGTDAKPVATFVRSVQYNFVRCSVQPAIVYNRCTSVTDIAIIVRTKSQRIGSL